MSGLDPLLCVGELQAWQADVQVDVQTKSTGDLADTDVGGDRSVCRDSAFFLTGNEFQRADEAGRVARSE